MQSTTQHIEASASADHQQAAHGRSQKAPTRFIRPDVLSQISGLDLIARSVVEGFVAGLHRSPFKGFSVDFMEYRPYITGDDLMHVDWKAFARTDRLFVKEFEDETNTHLQLLVDVSASMGFRSSGISKFEYGMYLAASLAYLVVRQRDAVGLTLFDDNIVQRVPARSTKGHLVSVLKELENVSLGQRSNVGKPLHELAERHRKRGLAVVVSDFLDDLDEIVDGLKHFRFKGHDVMLFQVLDPAELNFTFSDLTEFEDLETGERLIVEADAARSEYMDNLKRFQDRLRRECGLLGIDYSILSTDQPLDFALFNYLAGRSRRRR